MRSLASAREPLQVHSCTAHSMVIPLQKTRTQQVKFTTTASSGHRKSSKEKVKIEMQIPILQQQIRSHIRIQTSSQVPPQKDPSNCHAVSELRLAKQCEKKLRKADKTKQQPKHKFKQPPNKNQTKQFCTGSGLFWC